MDRVDRLPQALHAAFTDGAGDVDALDALSDLEVLDEFVTDYAQARVDDARVAGVSSAQIADRLGATRQAAHKRFGSPRGRKRTLEFRLIREKDKK